MKILVTGGAGYIGSHTCVDLLQEGHEVIVVDNFSNSEPQTLSRIEAITGTKITSYEADLLDREALRAIFTEHPVEAVIHFAGCKAVGESAENPLRYYKNNVAGTLHLLEIMKEKSVRKFVFSSSATVYGNPKKLPLQEDAPLSAVNPYGRTKWMVEEILRDLCDSDGEWRVIILRYFNPVGAHASGLIGERPQGIPNNLMPYLTQVAAGERPYLNLYGDDYPTADGTCVRDYIHVVDLARGHSQALRKLKDLKGVEVYNLGTGKGYSVLEVIKAFEKVNQLKVPYQRVGRRPGDVPRYCADASKAYRELHWQAERSIEQMCEDAWNFQKKSKKRD